MTKIIRGTITNQETNNPLSNYTVKVFEKRTTTILKGEVITNDNGNYSIEIDVEDGSEIFIEIYKDGTLVSDDSTTFLIPDQETIKNYTLSIGIPGRVTGKIVNSDGSIPDGNFTVKVYRKTFLNEEEIGSVGIDSSKKGLFEVLYTKEQNSINIFARLYNSNNEVINTTDLIINAENEIDINFLVEGDMYFGPTKISKYTKLDELFVDREGNKLDLSIITSVDVKVLAEQENLDEKTIKHYIRASQIVDGFTIDTNKNSEDNVKQIVFALLQKGKNINFASLLLKDSLELEKSLKEASDDNILVLKGRDGKKLNNFEEVIANFKSIVVDNLSNLDSRSSDNELVLFDIIDNLSTSKRISFIESYLENKESDEDFWDNLTGINDSEKEVLKYKIDLALFSRYNQIVFAELKNFPSTNLKELSEQSINWNSITNNITDIENFPIEIKGTNLDEKRENFASYLSNQMSTIHLSGVIKVSIENDDFGPDVKNYINNNPNFNFFTDKVTGSGNGLEETKKIQRIASLLPNENKMQSLKFLWDNGLDSALSIINTGRKKFEKLAKESIDLTSANEIYFNAQKRHNKILIAMTKYSKKLNRVSSNIFVEQNEMNADIEALFGAFDYCEGEHCSSTLGAAAYLADNLKFLKEITIEDEDVTFYDKLIHRRPDIAKIDLNCKNTETLIPYIDVVNEVLEQAVIQIGREKKGQGINVMKGMQSNWVANKAIANPEHNFKEAYDYLKESNNPLNLPFNYWYEEAKIYLDHLGVGLYELIEKFPYQDTEAQKKIDYATDYLGFTNEEKAIILATSFNYTQLFDESRLKIRIKIEDNNFYFIKVTELLRQTGIEYDELIELLGTSYIGNKEIEYEEDCSLHNAYLKDFTFVGSYSDLHKLLRFKRLQNKLEWSALDLDNVILYLSNGGDDYSSGPFDEDFIIKLATIKRIKDETNADVEVMLSWWNDLENTTSNSNLNKSLYAKEFLNNAVVGENIASVDDIVTDETPINKLTLTDNRSEIKIYEEADDDAKPKLKDYVPDLIAGMNISANDINEVLNKEESFKNIANKSTINLTLQNVSKIYKRASFAKSLNISINNLYEVNRLMVLPIEEDTPEYTVKFIDFYKSLNRSGFSISDLHYLLENQDDGKTNLVSDQKKKEQFINSLIDKVTTHYNNANNEFAIKRSTQKIDFNDEDRDIYIESQYIIIIKQLDNALSSIVSFNTKNDLKEDNWHLTEDNKSIILEYCKGNTSISKATVTTAINNSKQVFRESAEAVAFIVDDNNTPMNKAFFVLMATTSLLVENEITQEFSSHFDIDTGIAKDLLYKYIRVDNRLIITIFNQSKVNNYKILPNIDSTDYFIAYEKMHKAVTFINKFALTKEMIAGINEGVTNYNWLNIFDLPTIDSVEERYNKWFKLFSVIDYNYTLFNDKISIFDFFKNLTEEDGFISSDSLEELTKITSWDKEHTQFLLEQFELTELGTGNHFDYKDIIWIQKLNEATKILKRTGVKPIDIIYWINSKENDKFFASKIRLDVKSKYTSDEWDEVAPTLMSNLREKRRDALSSFLILEGFDGQRFKDTNDIYAYFLFDTEMSSCSKTSRIVLAHSVLQLFVMRINLNLEKHNDKELAMPKSSSEEWKWRKKYRVWEANRKVFLYPENWIEPELRDDKSELFTELEDTLKQVDITDEAVEKAYRNYLEKLGDISKLEIAQHYHDVESDTLYVFAHTYEQPHQYFFRTRDTFGEWSAWERVNVEIESKNMVPVIFRNKLYIFWLQTTHQSEGVSDDELKIDTNISEYQGKRPKIKNEYKIAWSEYRDGKWTAKKLFNKSIQKAANISNEDDISLSAYINPNNPTDVFIYLLPNTLDTSDYFANGINNLMITNDLTNLKKQINIIKDRHTTKTGGTKNPPVIICKPGHPNWPDCMEEPFNIPPPHGGGGGSSPYEVERIELKGILQELNMYSLALSVITPTLPPKIHPIFKSLGTSKAKLVKVLEKLYIQADNVNVNNIPVEFTLDKVVTYFFRFRPNADVFGAESTLEYNINNIENGIKEHNKVLLDKEDALSFIYNGNTVMYYDDNNDGKDLIMWEEYPDATILIDPQNHEDNTLATRRITLPHQYQFYRSQAGAFLEDDDRVFFIEPDIQFSNIQVGNPAYTKGTFKQVNALFPIINKSLPVVESAIDYNITAKVIHKNVKQNIFYKSINDTEDDVKQGLGAKAIYLPAKYQFYSFYHPYTDLFINQVSKYGVEGLLAPKNADATGLVHQALKNDEFFESIYNPTNAIKTSYPVDNIDFEYKGAYSVYNWELFFHAPLMIAERLSKNKQFEEAQKWFHYIFDPTESEGNAPARYWRIKPFAEYNESVTIMDLMQEINSYNQDYEVQIEKWQQNPFKPHLIARLRVIAYMKNVLMKYLDNLIAWGDSLFKKDSIEYINEAVQIYILAANILGRQPVKIKRGTLGDGIPFDEMGDLGPFGNLMIDLEDLIYQKENQLNINNSLFTKAAKKINKKVALTDISANDIGSLTTVLYFGIPENSKMLSYWNTVADRLFKIRHCMNIKGVERQLALFEPVIDPALLVNAVANGISIGDALADMQATMPHYRFRYLLQKAVEYTNEIKALGQALLSALEKRDAEKLALIRSGHEESLLNAMIYIKEQGVKEAQENIKALELSKTSIIYRRDFYKNRKPRILQEKLHLSHLNTAHQFQQTAQGIEALATYLAMLPTIDIGIEGFGASPVIKASLGGQQLSTYARGAGIIQGMIASNFQHQATVASIKGGYDRRQEDWDFQRDSAKNEIKQIEKQIISSQIRLAIAEKDLQNHQLQIENSLEAKAFMENKYTNAQLYEWMVGQISNLHFTAYQIAYDMAKKAEKTYQFELGKPLTSFIKTDNWDSLREGLLAGDKLQQQLRQLETSYIDNNERENELTKQISLAMLNPNAIIELRATGKCTFDVPEVLYDIDFPGHYFRRIKSVSLTIPSVTGPYTGVNCKLTLLNNRFRKNTEIGSGYAQTASDTRFAEEMIPKTVATSSGRNDAGMFEVNFNDERYLPFEGKGAIGTWNLELPDQFRQFDYDTINDVILTINYTAREGGIKTQVVDELTAMVEELSQNTMLSRMISLKAEFSDNLHELLTNADMETVIGISKKHIPYLFKDKGITVNSVKVFAKVKDDASLNTNCKIIINDTKEGTFINTGNDTENWPEEFYLASISSLNIPIEETETDWKFNFNNLGGLTSDDFEDIILVLEYSVA